MALIHRQDDLRSCGHKTVVTGQDFLKIDGKLAAVVGDQDNAGGGALISTGINTYVKINNKLVIVVGDTASPDAACSPFNPAHCHPDPVQGSDFIKIT